MRRRLLAGFLGVLAAVIAAVIVPLGVIVTGQQRDDFRDGTRTAARAVAAVAEEQLDDHKPGALTSALPNVASARDRIVVLDADGRVVARTGAALPKATLAAARSGETIPDPVGGTVAVSAAIGDSGRLGLVVLARDTGPLEERQRTLWTWLASAAAAALALGAAVGTAISRWIARPLHALAGAAEAIRAGHDAARADSDSGPPEIRQVAGTFNSMAQHIAVLLEAQRGMTAEVSHQLRTPLSALRLRLELFASDLDAGRAEEIDAMLAEIARLTRLVDGLLAVARAEASPASPEPIDLRELVRDRLSAWQPVADDRAVALRFDDTTPPVMARANPGHVEQILDNLLDNALTAAVHAHVTVSAWTDDAAVLTVADTGPGMSVERRAHALDRYYTDRTGDGGTGLGLHVVTRLVAANHGTIALCDTIGGGLTVRIHLPADRPG